MLIVVDQDIVVVALPEIGRDLGYSAQTLQSVYQRVYRDVKRLSVVLADVLLIPSACGGSGWASHSTLPRICPACR